MVSSTGHGSQYTLPPVHCRTAHTPLCNHSPASRVWTAQMTSSEQETATVMGCPFHDSLTEHFDFRLANTHSLAFLLAHSGEENCHVQKPTWQRTKGGLHLSAHEEMNPANNHVDKMLPSQGLRWWQSFKETLKQRIQISHTEIPDPQKLWDDKCCLSIFKATKFGAICHTAVSN